MALTQKQIDNRFAKREALLAQIEALKTQVAAIDDEMKGECEAQGVSVLYGTKARVRWNFVYKDSFDQTKFKKEKPELYAAYLTPKQSRPFYFEKLSEKEQAAIRTERITATAALNANPDPVSVSA